MSDFPSEVKAVVSAADRLIEHMTRSERDPNFDVVHYSYKVDLRDALKQLERKYPQQ